jgi:hypothetical protein
MAGLLDYEGGGKGIRKKIEGFLTKLHAPPED